MNEIKHDEQSARDLAIASLATSISMLIFSLGLFSLIGAILGHNALRKMNQINVHTDRGMALAGVIIGWIGTGLWILGVLIFIVFVSALGMFSFL
jgi:hypothetical protein